MSNEGGNNQFQGFGIEAPYGDIKKQTELLKEAPISGAPFSGRALGAPDRIREARRGQGKTSLGPGRPSDGGSPAVLPQLPIPYEQQIAMIWQRIAAHPGASPLVRQIAMEAQGAHQ